MYDFIWIMVSWLYRLYGFMVWLAWKCRGETSCAYLVDVHGNQLPLTEYYLETGDFPMTLLIIFYTKQGIRYRFVDIGNIDIAAVEETLTSCIAWSPPDYKIFGLMVRIKDHEYVMDPNEFSVLGNKWFTVSFNRWLCKNYLNVPVSDEIEAMIINSDMNMEVLTTPVLVHENALQALIEEENEDESSNDAEPSNDSEPSNDPAASPEETFCFLQETVAEPIEAN